MDYMISKDRKRLTIYANTGERSDLMRQTGTSGIQSYEAMYDWFESLIATTELEWIPEGTTDDLTSAPMLGILGEEGNKDHTVFLENHGLIDTGCDGYWALARPILERWAFMDYQVRSVLEDLRDKGECVFVSE